MRAEQIKKIYERVNQEKNYSIYRTEDPEPKAGMGGMGIVNSICRLKMIYGDEFHFSITNNKAGGTTVRLEGIFQKTESLKLE